MRFSSLSEWLKWQENLHFTEIDPGLDRLAIVWRNMGGKTKLPFKVVTVAGTNGKGSSVALTAAILQAAGYKTATYTSPHLLQYNERICINGTPCSDVDICKAFQRIDEARGDISLTYFEFATLAAADIFSNKDIDVAVLEVGMGGRLDAVNLFDADVALITPIALDHTQWLGDTREKIATEKAGIMRAAKPAVISDLNPPDTLKQYADKLGTTLYQAGLDYQYHDEGEHWHWHNANHHYSDLPLPALAGKYQLQNSAAVLQVCDLLAQQGLLISEQAIHQGLQSVRLAGRFQLIPGEITRILDVTHNQQGAQNLKALLQQHAHSGKTYAVLAMLRDKDTSAVAQTLAHDIDEWYLAGLQGSRGMSAETLKAAFLQLLPEQKLHTYETVAVAYEAALKHAQPGDTVLVFGSFHTVEAVMRMMPEFQPVVADAS